MKPVLTVVGCIVALLLLVFAIIIRYRYNESLRNWSEPGTSSTTPVPSTGATLEKNPFEDKICVCLGDSITGNMATPEDYPSVLANLTGMTVINGGFGGCRMSDTHTSVAYAAFSMVRLADAVSTGDWSLQDSLVNDLSVSTHAVEHLAALKAVDWNSVDYVTIAYGTNDINYEYPVEIDSDDPYDTKTYLGALRYSIDKIKDAYPHIEIILLTPIYRYFNDQKVDSDSTLLAGHFFTDWGDGLLQVAQDKGLKAIDMYQASGFNASNRELYYSEDGTHPNKAGTEVLGKVLASYFLDTFR